MTKKRDFFKAFMAFQYFMEGKEEDEENIQQVIKNENIDERNTQQLIRNKSLDEGISNEKVDILSKMCSAISEMTSLYDYITEISDFKKEVRDDIQLLYDLWLYTITKCARLGFYATSKIENVAQHLMDELVDDYPITVAEHLYNLEWNEPYIDYYASVYGEGIDHPGLFWELLSCMFGRDTIGDDDVTIVFTMKYFGFLKMLSYYLHLCHLDVSDEEFEKAYVREFVDKHSRVSQDNGQYTDYSLINPLIRSNIMEDSCVLEFGNKENAFNNSDNIEENMDLSSSIEHMESYDVNQAVWDNDWVKITYLGIYEGENYWGIKMLVENKTNKPLTVNADNICLNDFVVTSLETLVYGLPAHRKKYVKAAMMFEELEDLQINSIDEMYTIDLSFSCETNFEKIGQSSRVMLCVEKYIASKSNSQNKKHNERKDDTIYIKKKDEVLWDNEFVRIDYMGIGKGENYWGIKMLVENKTDDKLSIGTSDIEIDRQVIDVFPYIEFDLEAYSKKEKHISIGFDKVNDLGIENIEDFGDMELSLFCEKRKKKVAQSKQIVIHPVDYLKEIQKQMNEIMDEIDKKIIWKNSEENFPKTIEYEFVYPNGKHGDIDLYLISQWGVFEQTSSISFKANLSTEKLHIIELMVLFYYTRFSQNALLVNRNNNEMAVEFLQKYNNIMKLDNIYGIAAREMDRKDILESAIMQRAYNIIKSKYRELKDERSQIYADIVADNGASSRWKSEQQVYAIVRREYEDAIYQYHAEWLGRQSLDIYIPSLNVAIEYQGQQHYGPLDIFGGEEKFKIQQQQDSKKKSLCTQNGIRLIEWKYDILPNLENLKKVLKSNL